MHRSLGDYAIVIQVGYGVRQRIDAMHRVVRQGLGLPRLLGGGLRLLIDLGCLGRHLLNASHRPRLDVFNVFGVLGGHVIQLIGLVNERSRLLTYIVLAGASDCGRHTRCQQNN